MNDFCMENVFWQTLPTEMPSINQDSEKIWEHISTISEYVSN